MRIAQVAPLAESVPPLLYGGTERVVFNLTEELVRQGHQVTLFASGDSQTSGELVPCCARALRLDSSVLDPFAHMTVMLERVRQRAAEFDVLHFHIDYMHFPLMRSFAHRTLTTLHGRLDLPDLPVVFGEFQEMPLISISFDQRRALPSVNWVGNVYHGTFIPSPRNRLATTWPSSVGFARRSARTGPSSWPRRPASRSRWRPRSTRWIKTISSVRSNRCSATR